MPQYQAKAFRVVRCPLRISPPRSWLRGRARQHPQTTLKIFLMALQHIYTGKSKFTDEEIDEIDLEAPDLIPNRVATILKQSRPDLAGVIPANQSSRPHKVTPSPRRSPVHVARAGSANYVAAAIEEDQRPRALAQRRIPGVRYAGHERQQCADSALCKVWGDRLRWGRDRPFAVTRQMPRCCDAARRSRRSLRKQYLGAAE